MVTKPFKYPACRRCNEDIVRQHSYLMVCESCLIDISIRLFEAGMRGEPFWTDQEIENWYNELKKQA